MKKIYVIAIREGTHGYDVSLLDEDRKRTTLKNVHRNIVRCAIGTDLDYLMKAATDGVEWFRPLTASELADFKKYRDRDLIGQFQDAGRLQIISIK